MINRARLRANLAKALNVEEGRRRYVYRDSLGYETIAVGRLVDSRFAGAGLRDSEMDVLLDNDIDDRLSRIQAYSWFQACDTEPRQRALLDMFFELDHRLLSFTYSLAAIERKDWDDAARRLGQSLWAKQVPKRAARIIEMIRTGHD